MTRGRTIKFLLSNRFRPKLCIFQHGAPHQAKAQPSLRIRADGVGGLVAVSVDGDYYFPGYLNNGNVIGKRDEDGDIASDGPPRLTSENRFGYTPPP